MTLHVIPVNDLREHEFADCWCRPVIDEESGYVVHNSMDRREEFETGERKPS